MLRVFSKTASRFNATQLVVGKNFDDSDDDVARNGGELVLYLESAREKAYVIKCE